jgi:MFS family permease
LAEIATPGRKGFFCSWQSVSNQVSVMFAALLGMTLTFIVSPRSMAVWGWRIPFAIGTLIAPLLLMWLVKSLPETEAFLTRKQRPGVSQILASLGTNWKLIGVGIMFCAFNAIAFYLINAYTPIFGRTVLHLSARTSLMVTLLVALSNSIWLPIAGTVSDKIGRKPLLIFFAIATMTTAYPAMSWLVGSPSVTRFLTVELWLSCMYACFNGAMMPYLTEIMPPNVRTTGFALAYSVAVAVFGGFTPAICTFLIHVTGNRAMPAVWLSFAAVMGLSASLLTSWPRLRLVKWESSMASK